MDAMNILDLLLVLLLIGYGVSGFRQGFVMGALGVVGLLGGGLFGVIVTPLILRRFEPSLSISLIALAIVLGCAVIGQAVGAQLGAAVKAKMTWRPAYVVDAAGGVGLSMAAALVVCWILGTAVATAHLGELTRLVNGSAILSTVNRVMPEYADRAMLAFSRVVDPQIFPRYLAPFAPEEIQPTPEPDRAVLADPDIERAADSVVKILGVADQCARSLEGSGFVYSDDRVMTNAHVVAGVSDPVVRTRDGQNYPAKVVTYDPERDIAVLSVPDIDARALDFDLDAARGDSGAVLGYPGNGPFRAGASRIRAEQRLRGPNIYGSDEVVREVYSLYAEVRPGNSGGPLIGDDGSVAGLIFAASVEDQNTGYALTAKEVAGAARQGIASDAPVSTGACAR